MQQMGELISDQGVVKAPEPLSDEDRKAVAYFFARLKLIDPMAFDRLMPDNETEQRTKREFASMIRCYDKAQMDAGFAGLKRAQALGLRDYQFLTVSKVVGLIDRRGELPAGKDPALENFAAAGIYRESRPERLLEDKATKERRYAVGREECAKLLSLFDEEAA